MLIGFILAFIGVVGIALFAISKVPLLLELSEKISIIDEEKQIKERIEDKVKKEVKGIFEDFLQAVLQGVRKFVVKTEQITTKWLYNLKRKKRDEKRK